MNVHLQVWLTSVVPIEAYIHSWVIPSQTGNERAGHGCCFVPETAL